MLSGAGIAAAVMLCEVLGSYFITHTHFCAAPWHPIYSAPRPHHLSVHLDASSGAIEKDDQLAHRVHPPVFFLRYGIVLNFDHGAHSCYLLIVYVIFAPGRLRVSPRLVMPASEVITPPPRGGASECGWECIACMSGGVVEQQGVGRFAVQCCEATRRK